jgi:hypothetical protein
LREYEKPAALLNVAISMQIFLFWSQAGTDVFGFTFDGEGRNLPAEHGPWLKNDNGEAIFTVTEQDLTVAGVTNTVIRAVQRDGLYLARIDRPSGLLH